MRLSMRCTHLPLLIHEYRTVIKLFAHSFRNPDNKGYPVLFRYALKG
ncbi:Uncharacterised protein [Mycobacteroides abscessus subsp. abscessus]|nr:Uncharacterised protein [Mycobacteroides abscessus subsp. abscessus]